MEKNKNLIQIYADPSKHEKLKKLATADNRSLSNFLIDAGLRRENELCGGIE